MYDEILKQMREAAVAGCVYLTIHANKEPKRDRLDYGDIIHCLLTGEIIEQQVDDDWGEDKYLVYGDTQRGNEMAVVAKLGYPDSAVILTAYRLRITDYDI